MNPTDSPPLTVAMSVYNGERFLAAAIDSVLAQTFTRFEFLIIDDGSTDATPRILADYAARDARVRLIVRENRGLIVSLNQLLTEARAPIIARMDADDICMPERFALQMAFLAANPDTGVIGACCEDIDENGNPWDVRVLPHPRTHEEFIAAVELGLPTLCHPVVTYRRDLVRDIGGYHPAFRHCEDHDLWLRLSSVTRIGNLPQKLIRYRHYQGQVSSRHATVQQIGAAVAKIAWEERRAGRPDPTVNLRELPDLDQLDALFGREGPARQVRAAVARGLLYSRAGLRDHGFEVILRHIADGGDRRGMWRTVARLFRFGEPARAARLARALTQAAAADAPYIAAANDRAAA